MAYFPPFVDSAGLHLPTEGDIFEYEKAQFLSVYGQTVFTGNSEADTQWIAIFSLMINDAFNTAQLVVNSRSPATAIGADLDSVVKINGITRKSSTASQALLVLTGIPGTALDSVVVQDQNGFLWNLPPSVVILSGGTVNVTAVCQSSGAIGAPPNTINIRSTPVSGWTSVTNPSAAIPGQPVENDSQLRGRQAISVSLSSKTLVQGTLAGIAAVAGVTRFGTIGVENPTGSVDVFGNPAHSISMVVEGGTDLDVATAIYVNKTPGGLTNAGTTANAVTVPVVDPITGAVMNVGFQRPTSVPIFVTMHLHPLIGFTSQVGILIQNAIVAYLNGLQIGESLTISALYAVALSVMPSLITPQFSIQALFAGTAPGPTLSNDIAINFNQVTAYSSLNIILV